MSKNLIPDDINNDDIFDESLDTYDNYIIPRDVININKLSENKKFNNLYNNKLKHKELIEKYIIHDNYEDNLKNKMKSLNILLNNRSSKSRLQDLNIIKKEQVSDRLQAIGDKLSKQKNNETLNKLIANRPNINILLERGIINDDIAQQEKLKQKEDAKIALGNLFAKRPSVNDLVKINVLPIVDVTEVHVESQLQPSLIQGLSDAQSVYCSWGHTCVVSKSGDLYTFGSSEGGRLGLGDQVSAIKPTLVESLKAIGRIESFALGDNHCGAIVNGSLYTWGKGAWGRLGLGHQEDVNVPTLVKIKEPVSQVACGSYHTIILTKSGKVLSFGWAKNGRLGVGAELSQVVSSYYPEFKTENESEYFDRSSAFVPVPVSFLDDKNIIFLSAGDGFSLALSKDGKLYSWGAGIWGVLGNSDEHDVDVPKEIVYFSSNGLQIKYVSCGSTHSIASDGKNVYSWGRNNFSQLGRAVAKLDCTPAPVGESSLFNGISNLDAGKSNSAVVTSSGALFTFGHNAEGILGLGHMEKAVVPTLVEALTKISNVSCGWSHSAAVDVYGNVYSWGSNANGRLGL